jgi:hypothetical protein
LSSPIPTVHSATCDRGEGVAAGEEHGVTGGVRVEDAEEQMPGAEVDDARLGASSDVRRVASAAAMSRSSRWSSPICRAPRQRARRRWWMCRGSTSATLTSSRCTRGPI